MELLRLATAGSVDDGKSHAHRPAALRLQVDLRGPARSGRAHLAATAATSYTNLALLTDGLRAEREQGITIDVAYRYFATPKRKFIIADTPGHIQYTRNMVTGASTADLALVLVDARKGVDRAVPAPRVHRLAAADPAPRAVRQQDGPRRLRRGASSRRSSDEFRDFATKLDITDLTFIPISALHGDNVVQPLGEHALVRGPDAAAPPRGRATSRSDRNLIDARFPVQYVIRPMSDEYHDYRGYAGTVAGGVFKPGDEVVVLPVGVHVHASARIDTVDGPVDEAFPPMSVTVTPRPTTSTSRRGDMICRPQQPARTSARTSRR